MSSSTTNSCILRGEGCTSATNFPQFVDTAACLCGLLPSGETPRNGGMEQDWRCIGDGSGNLRDGGTGKWYNTSLPSAELSGINRPQNWGQNPPNTTQAYVLEDINGRPVYQELGSDGSVQLIGDDSKCTGRNDTELSAIYYSRGEESSNTTSSMMPSSTSSMASMTSMASSSSTTSGSTSASPTSSATSLSPSPSSTSGSSSEASHSGFKALVLAGMLLAPLVAGMA